MSQDRPLRALLERSASEDLKCRDSGAPKIVPELPQGSAFGAQSPATSGR